MNVRPIFIDRDDLAKFIKDPRTIRAFEDLNINQDDIVGSVSDLEAAPVIGVTLSDIFTADRALAGSSDILLVDGGAKANLGIELTLSGVSAGNYGDATHFIAIAVDDKGRLTLAAQYLATTDGVVEGANLYYTDVRARLSISGSSTASYDNSTGIISLTSGNVTTALGFTPISASSTDTLSNKTLSAPSITGLGNYLNDAAAAIGGVPVGGIYRNASQLMVRVA